jgi:hypothetical protein
MMAREYEGKQSEPTYEHAKNFSLTVFSLVGGEIDPLLSRLFIEYPDRRYEEMKVSHDPPFRAG